MGTSTIRKTIPVIILLAVFIGASFKWISEPQKRMRSEYRTTDLKQVVTKYDNIVRTDYIDDNGNLRIAANIGYATKMVFMQDNIETEIYLDDQGKRIGRYEGYYGILREYDAAGNNIRVTYLGRNYVPTVMSLKYAVEERTFNESGQQVSCRYLDAEGKPALSLYSGYGARYENDEKGRTVRITYLDETGEPMILSSGYSILVREYYETEGAENGKVKNEFYFLPDGTPVSLSLGQYGINNLYDENGLTALITYLDADGSPMVTNKGYTSVAYTYYANNSIQSTLYYDIYGNPFRMDEGQYGMINKNGQTVYLNADGTDQFNIKNYLYNHSGYIIFIAAALVVLSAFAGKKLNCLMLVIYIGVIIYFTLMYRDAGEHVIGVLRSYRRFLFSAEARADILKNIWLFIPFGAILSRLYPRKTILLVPVLASITIETVQYCTGMGICELGDVISNGLGGALGYGMSRIVQMIRKTDNKKPIVCKANDTSERISA